MPLLPQVGNYMGPHRNQISSVLPSDMDRLWLKAEARNLGRGGQRPYLFLGLAQPGRLRNRTDQPCEQVWLPSQTQLAKIRGQSTTRSFFVDNGSMEGHLAVLQGLLGLQAHFHGARAQPQTQRKRHKLDKHYNWS